MSLPRVFLLVCSLLFGAVGVAALIKTIKKSDRETCSVVQKRTQERAQDGFSDQPLNKKQVFEVSLSDIQRSDQIGLESIQNSSSIKSGESACPQVQSKKPVANSSIDEDQPSQGTAQSTVVQQFQDTDDHVQDLFQPGSSCPIVETIRYSSRVAWKPKRSAWLIDYANHYKTPVDFVLRSLNGGKSAKERPVSEGENFTVLRTDKNFYFLMVVGIQERILKLFYVLQQPNNTQDIHYLKSYQVGLGRISPEKASGCLSPLGIFRLGTRVAVFRPGMTGVHKGKKVELIQVFGTRWLPFEKEIAGCSEPAKGFGIHGTPWSRADNGQLIDHPESVGRFESDGCIRLKSPDIEELYAIISSRPGFVEIIPALQQSKLLKGDVSLLGPVR